MNDKMKITIEIPNTGLEEDILRKGEWDVDSLFGRSLRNALMHFTKDSFCPNYALDKIRAEIKEWYWQADKQALAKDPCVVDAMIDLFIRTIEKHQAESNDKTQKSCKNCRSFQGHAGHCDICHDMSMYKES